VVPVITEAAAEHRMYLPLAAVTTLGAVCFWKWLGRGALPLTVMVALALGLATWLRNEDYREPERLWRSSLALQPNVARAHENLGLVLVDEGREDEAIMELRTALRLTPEYPEGENNLGEELARTGALDEAAQLFAKAAQGIKRPQPRAMAYFNLGNTLGLQGRYADALAAYTQTAQLQPNFAPAQNLRGYVLHKMGRDTEAITAYQAALRLQPVFPLCETNLGDAFAKLGRWPEASAAFENALREDPNFTPARTGLEAAREQSVASR
jgi:tetratricopeptide (TPR) repeat protein